ncbi:MAG TPA: hypothetical protein VF283_01625 [Bryobacteraceae bacterium]
MKDLLQEKWKRWMSEPPPEHLFEMTERALASASPRHPAQPKLERLAERGLTASPSAPNLVKPQTYAELLPKLRGGAAVVIPDYAVRMTILDFEEFPSGQAERSALVRFRLRKSVPFPIDEAQVSYAVQLQEPKRVEVLAVAIARPILEEYEAIFTSAGYRVGLVTPSSLATLPLCPAGERGLTVLAKAAETTLTVLLLEQGLVRLVRCIDISGEEDGDPATVLSLLQQTIAYAEDQVGQPVARLLLCGFGTETESLGRLVEEEFQLPYEVLRSRFGAPAQQNAGLFGLLEQYAA